MVELNCSDTQLLPLTRNQVVLTSVQDECRLGLIDTVALVRSNYINVYYIGDVTITSVSKQVQYITNDD